MRNIFTGIIEELGVVKSIAINGASGCITIKAKIVLEGTQLGDSIAVNGTLPSMASASPSPLMAAATLRQTSCMKPCGGLDLAVSAQAVR